MPGIITKPDGMISTIKKYPAIINLNTKEMTK